MIVPTTMMNEGETLAETRARLRDIELQYDFVLLCLGIEDICEIQAKHRRIKLLIERAHELRLELQKLRSLIQIGEAKDS